MALVISVPACTESAFLRHDSSGRKCIRKCVKTFYAVCPQTCKIPFHRLISRTVTQKNINIYFSPQNSERVVFVRVIRKVFLHAKSEGND